jgi:hypothetical protein
MIRIANVSALPLMLLSASRRALAPGDNPVVVMVGGQSTCASFELGAVLALATYAPPLHGRRRERSSRIPLTKTAAISPVRVMARHDHAAA